MHSAYLLGLYEEGSFEEEAGSRVQQQQRHLSGEGVGSAHQQDDDGPEHWSTHGLHHSSRQLQSPTIGMRHKLRSLELSQVVFGE